MGIYLALDINLIFLLELDLLCVAESIYAII